MWGHAARQHRVLCDCRLLNTGWLAGWHVAGQPLSTASLVPAGLAGIPATGPVVVADRLAEAALLLLKLWPQRQRRWRQRRWQPPPGSG